MEDRHLNGDIHCRSLNSCCLDEPDAPSQPVRCRNSSGSEHMRKLIIDELSVPQPYRS